MGNRSNINLVGNTTQGQNVGGGDACLFKGKGAGNILQFRTISATGTSTQIQQIGDVIYIWSEGGSSGTTYSFENGLTKTVTTVRLGGDLTQNTQISGGTAYSMTFDTCSMYMCGLPSKTSETCALYIGSDGKLSTGLAGEGGGGITGSTNGLTDDGERVCLGGTLTQNTVFTGGASNYHLRYAADYSADYNARSIPDVDFVTGYTQSAVTQTSNTVAVCNISVVSYTATTANDFIGSSGTCYVYLPATPKPCQRITVADIAGTALYDNVTIYGNGMCINGMISGCDYAIINTNYGSISFINNGYFWSAIAFIN